MSSDKRHSRIYSDRNAKIDKVFNVTITLILSLFAVMIAVMAMRVTGVID